MKTFMKVILGFIGGIFAGWFTAGYVLAEKEVEKPGYWSKVCEDWGKKVSKWFD